MKGRQQVRSTRKATAMAATMMAVLSVGALTSMPAFALKYAPVEHHLRIDPSISAWKPGEVQVEPEEQLRLVGADVMDEITLGWIKLYRKAYPRMSVTMEAKASGTGGPALTNGAADLAPVGRELLPAEEKAFVDKFGYKPMAIRVATGSVGSLGKTAASVVLVDKDNPLKGLTLAQLDAIYSKTRNRGHADITRWGDLGLGGDWADRPIHLYGLKPVNGIEYYLKLNVLEGGAYKDNIEFVKGKGFTHAFTVAAEDMATHPGGLTYALLANVTPNVKVLPLAEKEGEPFLMPTVQNVYTHKYPLSRYVYIFVNKKPGEPLQPKVKEFLKAVLSAQGQDVVAKEGVYIPLTPDVVKQELAKLENAD
ncbi:PstS family phosphate ABC transporter substrate-binding protein [Paraburkholderia sp. CI3]|uniref:PstS family phosphate ABC transporter substrate-binding protein n=1 Tax=Paraburkholderia sp. CI3 TaxID=2991060 RepID=UPI003D1EBEDB